MTTVENGTSLNGPEARELEPRILGMRAYTFRNNPYGSNLTEGLELVDDPKFGKTIVLGGEKRGRWARVSFDRYDPPLLSGNTLPSTDVKKVELPAREVKPAKTFYTLTKPIKPSSNVLVRVNTEGVYTKNTFGNWSVISGTPETVASGSGTHTDSERISGWTDSLVILHPGDVIKVTLSGGHKFQPYVLSLDPQGRLVAQDFEVWQASQTVAKVQSEKTAAEVLHGGTMPVYSFGFRRGEGWGVTPGITTQTLTSGARGFQLGPREGNWRVERTVTIPVGEGVPDNVSSAAVAKAEGKLVLVASEQFATGKYLVRVDTNGLRKGGRTAAVAYRGIPTLVIEGSMTHGTANEVHHRDQLWVIVEGDVLRIGQMAEEGKNDYVLFIEGGEVKSEDFCPWQLRDARRDPAPYIESGWCPIDRLPETWVGCIVDEYTEFRDDYRGPFQLVQIRQEVLLNGEWNALKPSGRNPNFNPGSQYVWLKIRPDLVASAAAEIKEIREVLEFGEPPLPSGTRVFAHITTEHKHHEASYGRSAYDSTVYTIEVADVPAQKYRVTRYEKSGQEHENRERLEEVKAPWTYQESLTADGRLYKIDLSAGVTELNGEFAVEFWAGRKGGWGVRILTQEMLDQEREQILAEVKGNAPLRKFVRQIPGHESIYGMPIDEKGDPCEPDQADQWVLYMKDHRWPSAYPDAFVLVPMKGYRSLSTGKSFATLVDEFTRK